MDLVSRETLEGMQKEFYGFPTWPSMSVMDDDKKYLMCCRCYPLWVDFSEVGLKIMFVWLL